MSDIRIFVSCGQRTREEIFLGNRIKDEIDRTPGFRAYFAETVHDLDGLNKNIYEALFHCSGAVIFLHKRGTFTDADGNTTERSSLWINQEIAILSYRQFHESQRIPVLAFKETSVKLDGAMTFMMLNPLPVASEDEMILEVRNWLKKESFGVGKEDIFKEKWSSVTDNQRKFMTCLIDEGEKGVKEAAIRKRLVKEFSLSSNEATDVIRDAKLRLTEIGFIEYVRNIDTGDEFGIHDSWKFLVRREISKWKSGAKTA